jgi:hypothetical protein
MVSELDSMSPEDQSTLAQIARQAVERGRQVMDKMTAALANPSGKSFIIQGEGGRGARGWRCAGVELGSCRLIPRLKPPRMILYSDKLRQ